jgi:hypothetical protein
MAEMNTILLFLLGVLTAHAQLSVTVSPVKVTAQKAVVPLAMTNHLAETIESARAVVFLTDDQGKMLGQKTGWVIGGSKERPGLESGHATNYNFVVTGNRPLTDTNLAAKVIISQLILAGGKVVDVNKHVQIQPQKPSK